MGTTRLPDCSPIIQMQLPQHAVERLSGLILRGALAPGTRLIERELCEQLGISRTPVREALFRLAGMGLACDRRGRGFFVADLSEKEIIEIYQAIAALERSALLHLEDFPPAAAKQILKAQRKFEKAGSDIEKLIAADASWHDIISGMSQNRKLLEALGPLRMLSTRYERVYFNRSAAPHSSIREHEEILQMLASRKHREAAAAVEAHWLGNIAPMLAAIEATSQHE